MFGFFNFPLEAVFVRFKELSPFVSITTPKLWESKKPNKHGGYRRSLKGIKKEPPESSSSSNVEKKTWLLKQNQSANLVN